MNAMSTYKENVGVQEKACFSLGNIVSNDGMFCLCTKYFLRFISCLYVSCFLTDSSKISPHACMTVCLVHGSKQQSQDRIAWRD
jgi:hypothetical protein